MKIRFPYIILSTKGLFTLAIFAAILGAIFWWISERVDKLWMFRWEGILQTFVTHLLVHIHQKKKNRSKNLQCVNGP
jgi:uncharacterized membrane protein YvlD (DUF360 family)